MECLYPDRTLAGNAAVKSVATRSTGMPLQGHQHQRFITALNQSEELHGVWNGLCTIRGNEHCSDRGFTRNAEEGRSEPFDAGKEEQIETMTE